MQAHVESNVALTFFSQIGVGPEHHVVGVQVAFEVRKRVFCQAVGVSQRKIELGARHVFPGYRAELSTGSQLRAHHFG